MRWSGSAKRRARPGRAPAMPRPRTSGFRCARSSAPPNSSATRPRPPKAWSTALVKDGKDADSLEGRRERLRSCSTRRRSTAESGGQVGDTGLMIGEGVKFRVTDTQKKAGDLFVHLGTVEQGTLKVGTALQLEVDHARRVVDPRASLGDASAARGAAAGARRSHRPARFAGRAGSLALRLRASEADHAGRTRPRRGHRQRRRAAKMTRSRRA